MQDTFWFSVAVVTDIKCQNHPFPHTHLCWHHIPAIFPKEVFFTLFGMDKPQTSFQTPLSWFKPTMVGLFKLSLSRNLKPDCLVYWPKDVYGQINLSSAEELKRGMLCIKSTSCGLNKPCNKLESHYFTPGSMRSATFDSSKPQLLETKFLDDRCMVARHQVKPQLILHCLLSI